MIRVLCLALLLPLPAAAQRPDALGAVPVRHQAPGPLDPELVIAGRGMGGLCRNCHLLAGEGRSVGPSLDHVAGHPAAGEAGFPYSPALRRAAAAGLVWDAQALDALMAHPFETLPQGHAEVAPIDDPYARAAIVSWMQSLARQP